MSHYVITVNDDERLILLEALAMLIVSGRYVVNNPLLRGLEKRIAAEHPARLRPGR